MRNLRIPTFFFLQKASLLALFFCLVTSTFSIQAQDKKDLKVYQQVKTWDEEENFEEIILLEKEVLRIAYAAKDTLAPVLLGYLGDAYLFSGNYPKAVQYYEKELPLRIQFYGEGTKQHLDALANLAYTYAELGEYRKAAPLYEQQLKLDAEFFGKESEEYLGTVFSIADFYVKFDQGKKAEKLYLDLLKQLGDDHHLSPSVKANLGNYYTDAGFYSKGERNLLEAMIEQEELSGYYSEPFLSILFSLANHRIESGRYAEAEDLLRESDDLLVELDFPKKAEFDSYIHNALGRVYYYLGNYDESLMAYRRALQNDMEMYGENSYYIPHSLLNISASLNAQKKYSEAIENVEEALELINDYYEANHSQLSSLLNNRAFSYFNMKRFEEALMSYEKALKIDQDQLGKKHPDYAVTLFNLGKLHQSKGDLKKAEKYLKESQKIRQEVLGENHPRYAESLNQLAIFHWKKGNHKDVQRFYSQTFDNYFRQIEAYFPVLSEQEKAKFYNNKLKLTFEEFNSYAVERSKAQPSLLADMYNYQLNTKGLIMYASVKVRKSIMESGDEKLIGKYRDWMAVKEQLSNLYSSTGEDLISRNKKIDSLSKRSNDLEKDLSAASAQFADAYVKKNQSWQDVQKTLKAGEAAIEMIRFRKFNPDSSGRFTNDIYYAALLVKPDTKNHPELILIENGQNIEGRFLSNYRNAIRYRIDEEYSYQLFWGPIAKKLNNVNKLYFSPDGVYNQISLQTLRNPETSKFLIDELDIRLVTNTKDLLTFVDQKDKKLLEGGKAHLFGFPNYNLGLDDVDQQRLLAQSVTQAAAQDRTADVELGGRDRGTRGASRNLRGRSDDGGLTRGGISRGLRGNLQRYVSANSLIAELPGTMREIETISEIYDGKTIQPITYSGDQAVEANIKAVQGPHTLHIATHGFFLEDSGHPEDRLEDKYVENPLLRAGLILAGANRFLLSGEMLDNEGNQEDGILTAFEAMNLNLDNTELVVLSACETGIGQVQNGEGVYGLQRAFQIAGAKSVIMSMWAVDDDATQELMTLFYQHWLGGKSKHDAFVLAQKELKEKYPQPFYWGAFVMIGE